MEKGFWKKAGAFCIYCHNQKQNLMKHITKPTVAEKAFYTCDVTGEPLQDGPEVVLVISNGYGSPYDGDKFELHLSEKAGVVVLPLLRALLLDGGPLEPHLVERMFVGRCKEPRITRKECARLLLQLAKLRRYKKRTLATVKQGLKESAEGKCLSRGSFVNRPRKARKHQ